MQNNNKQRVGIEKTDFCYIGYLDEEHKVPTSEDIKCVYVNLLDGRFIVAFEDEIIKLK